MTLEITPIAQQKKTHNNLLRKKNKKNIIKKTIISTKEQEFHNLQKSQNHDDTHHIITDDNPLTKQYNNIYSAIRSTSTFNLTKFKEIICDFLHTKGNLAITSASGDDLLTYSILYNNIDSLNYLLEFPWECHNEKSFQNFAIKNAAHKNPDVYAKTIELYKEHHLINDDIIQYIFTIIPKNIFRKENINITISLMELIYSKNKDDELPIQLFKDLVIHKNFNFIDLLLENKIFKDIIKKNIESLNTVINDSQYKYQINKSLNLIQHNPQIESNNIIIPIKNHQKEASELFKNETKLPIVKIKKARKAFSS